MPPRHLSDHLLAHGRAVVTLADVAQLTGYTPSAARAALARLRASRQIFSPHPGLYFPVPPQYRTWGVLPGLDFIDHMMGALNRRYYVALLSAAEIHGAAHQRPQVFQVMVDRPVQDRDLERVRLRFFVHARIGDVPTVRRNTATGQATVATPETTCLDLVTHPIDSGGISNVATIIAELAMESKVDSVVLGAAAAVYPHSSVRRLGWLIEHLGVEIDTEPLHARLPVRAGKRATTRLEPTGSRRGTTSHRGESSSMPKWSRTYDSTKLHH